VKYAGGIAGEINSGSISNVVANVKFTDIRVANAGGLVAYQSGSGEIRFENVDVTLDYHEKTSNGLSGQNVGGILGTSRKAFVSGKVKFNYTNLNESIVGSVGAVSGVLAGGLTTNLDITINDVAYTGDINNKTTNSLVGTYGTANLGGSISEGD